AARTGEGQREAQERTGIDRPSGLARPDRASRKDKACRAPRGCQGARPRPSGIASGETMPDASTPDAPEPLLGKRRGGGSLSGEDEAAFEQRLNSEILITERYRVTLLALIPGLSMLVFLAASAASPDLTATLYDTQGDRLTIGLFLGGISTYEF